MSIYPCDWHGQRVDGPLSAAYLSALDGSTRYRRRLRLCGTDLSELQSRHGAHWLQVGAEYQEAVDAVCAACGALPGEREPTWTVFATIYPKGKEREDYFGILHEPCAEGYVTELGLKMDTSR